MQYTHALAGLCLLCTSLLTQATVVKTFESSVEDDDWETYNSLGQYESTGMEDDDDTTNALFPYVNALEEQVVDVIDMQYYGEEPTEDEENMIEKYDIQDELELEYGVPVADDDEESEGDEDTDEPPPDEELLRKREEWMRKNMKGNGKSWEENFRRLQKEFSKNIPDFSEEEPEILEDEDEVEEEEEEVSEDSSEDEELQQTRKDGVKRKMSGNKKWKKQIQKKRVEARNQRKKDRKAMRQMKRKLQKLGAESEEDRSFEEDKELYGEDSAISNDMDSEDNNDDITSEKDETRMGRRKFAHSRRGRKGGKGKKGGSWRANGHISEDDDSDENSEDWHQQICDNEGYAQPRKWKGGLVRRCCSLMGERKRKCLSKIFQNKVDRICRNEDIIPAHIAVEAQEELLDSCCTLEVKGMQRIKCFIEKRQQLQPRHRGPHRHHRHHKHNNGSLDGALCRRLRKPFTPGKFHRHLLKDMDAADGELWRGVWEARRLQLAHCCDQEEMGRKECMVEVREERWDRVCLREEPLPHWQFSGEETEEIIDTCCQIEGDERYSCFNNTVKEKRKTMVSRKMHLHQLKRKNHMQKKVSRVCKRVQSQDSPHKKAVTKVHPKLRTEFKDIWQKRREELIQCCNVVGEDRSSCLEDMRADRYDRICEGEEPLNLRRMRNNRKMQKESPLVTKCCQLQDEDRYSCFNESVAMKRPWKRNGEKNENQGEKSAPEEGTESKKEEKTSCCNAGREHEENVKVKRHGWRVCSAGAKSYRKANVLAGRQARVCERVYRRCCKNAVLSRFTQDS